MIERMGTTKKKNLLEIDTNPIELEQRIEVDFIGGNEMAKFSNEFMHAGDVFEKGKQLGIYHKMTVTGNMNVDIKNLCKNIKDSWEKAGGYALFVAINNIDGVRPGECYYYLKEGIQTISEGKKYYLLADFLRSLGYDPKVSKQMHVVSIGYKK